MTLSELLADYLEEGQGNLSKTTWANYKCRVRRYVEALGLQSGVSAIERRAVQRWINTVGAHSPHAVRMHHAAIRHFCLYLKQEGYLPGDPLAGVVLPKLTKQRRDTCPDAVVAALVDACDRLPRTPYKRTLAKAAVSLLAYAGLRRQEALLLNVEDIDLAESRIFVRNGKGQKSRNVYVPKECMDAVRALLRVRPECEHERLLAYNRRYGLMFHGLRNLLDDLHTIAGLKERYTPHQLRHAYASRLARNGAPLPAIQRALGHTRLETTAIYLHADDEQVKDIAHLASLKPAQEAETRETRREKGLREKPLSQTKWRQRVALRRAA